MPSSSLSMGWRLAVDLFSEKFTQCCLPLQILTGYTNIQHILASECSLVSLDTLWCWDLSDLVRCFSFTENFDCAGWVLVGWKTVLHSPRWFLSLLGAVGACQVNDTAPNHMGMGCMDLRCTPRSRCYCIQKDSYVTIFRFVEFNLSVQSQPTSLSNRPGCWRQPVLSVFLTQGRQTKESQARTQTAVFVYMDPSSLRDCRAASSPKRLQSLCKRIYRYLQ